MGHFSQLNSKWLHFNSAFCSMYMNTILGLLLYLILTVTQLNLNLMNLYKTKSLVFQVIFLAPAIVKCACREKYTYQNTRKPCHREHILPVPWSFVISRFYCMCLCWKIQKIQKIQFMETTRMIVFITGPFSIITSKMTEILVRCWNNSSIILS